MGFAAFYPRRPQLKASHYNAKVNCVLSQNTISKVWLCVLGLFCFKKKKRGEISVPWTTAAICVKFLFGGKKWPISTFYKTKELDQIAVLTETYEVTLRAEYLLQEKRQLIYAILIKELPANRAAPC